MRIFVLGGYGLLGSSVVARLLQLGHQVVGLTRSPAASRHLNGVDWRVGDLAQLTSTDNWYPFLSGCDAVVNCAGALQDSPRDCLHTVHVTGPGALYRACVALGIRRVVHVSSVGVGTADTVFGRTKREAEAALSTLDLDWVILRPGLVLGPNAYGGTALLRGLAGFPFVVPVLNAGRIVQIVSVNDVAESVCFALSNDAPKGVIWELVQPERTTLGDIVLGYRAWLGFQRRPLCQIPYAFARIVSLIADAIAYLGWRSPLRTTTLKQFASGVEGAPSEWMRDTGIRPQSLDDIFRSQPSGVQERWFARAYFVKPLGLALLAFFWIYSGLIALGPGFDAAVQALRGTALPEFTAVFAVIAGAFVDIGLGLAVAIRRTSRLALLGMIVVCALYVVAGSILRPDLWLDPLGGLVKIIPIAFVALSLLALMEER